MFLIFLNWSIKSIAYALFIRRSLSPLLKKSHQELKFDKFHLWKTLVSPYLLFTESCAGLPQTGTSLNAVAISCCCWRKDSLMNTLKLPLRAQFPTGSVIPFVCFHYITGSVSPLNQLLQKWNAAISISVVNDLGRYSSDSCEKPVRDWFLLVLRSFGSHWVKS